VASEDRTDRDRLRGWACEIRTAESVRELSDCNFVTTSFEVGAKSGPETLPVQAAQTGIAVTGVPLSQRDSQKSRAILHSTSVVNGA
jgi:hypothetical protein